jgi:GcrA cell cycle regulator
VTGPNHTQSFDWTDAAIIRLKELWQAEKSMQAIARELGCTKDCIMGKAHRLDLPPRPSPIIRYAGDDGPAPKPARMVRQGESTLPPIICDAPPPQGAAGALFPLPAGSRARTCAWPLWGFGERPTHRYCDALRLPERSYCAAHARKAGAGYASPRAF